jgi:peptidoglycan/xylan/chitin deacetylase (PgdA/CDA1 family)
MFHSLTTTQGDDFYLAFDAAEFAHLLDYLVRHRWRFLTVADVLDGAWSARDKNVLITFDDGFADNYSVLFPLLGVYSAKATIFVSTDFVQESALDAGETGSRWLRGYLSAAQIREMSSSGLVDFQAHSATHTWWPTGPEVAGVRGADAIDEAYWVFWNAFPHLRASATRQEMLDATPAAGFFVFDYARALNCRRFVPEWGELSGRELRAGQSVPGSYESPEEQVSRYQGELVASRVRLESLTGRPVRCLCWPGGEVDEEAYAVFRDAGYEACTVPSSAAKSERAARLFAADQAVLWRQGGACSWHSQDLGFGMMVRRLRRQRSPSVFTVALEKATPFVVSAARRFRGHL